MKIKHLLILGISILAISANAAASDVDNSSICVKEAKIESFDPGNNKDWFSVTKGQTFEGIVVESSGKCINVKSGKENDVSNRNWVQNNMTARGILWNNEYMVGSLEQYDGLPEKLNFAILGTLTLTSSKGRFICQNVHIAQGHGFSRNNWWIFNNNHIKTKSLLCYDSIHDEFTYVYPYYSNSNTFYFRFGHRD